MTWTSDREALVALLSDNHADLAYLYRQAVEALGRGDLSLAAMMIAGHCVRELVSALPRVLGDPIQGYTDVSRPALELYRAWTADNLPMESSSADDETPRAVSAEVFRAASRVAAAAATGNQNSRELTALLATGIAKNTDDPAMRRLHSAIEFFRSWTHAHDYSKPDRATPTADVVELELRIVEDALLTRLGNMADRARAVRDMLAKANRRSTGGVG